VILLSSKLYVCTPAPVSFIEGYAFEPAAIGFWDLTIVRVLGRASQSQVGSAIVQGVAVNVVDLLSTWGVDDQPVHEDSHARPSAKPMCCIERPAIK
jgi:hypothetical protein